MMPYDGLNRTRATVHYSFYSLLRADNLRTVLFSNLDSKRLKILFSDFLSIQNPESLLLIFVRVDDDTSTASTKSVASSLDYEI